MVETTKVQAVQVRDMVEETTEVQADEVGDMAEHVQTDDVVDVSGVLDLLKSEKPSEVAAGKAKDLSFERTTSEDGEDATKLADIADRMDSEVFPVAEPAKQRSLSQCKADEVLARVQKEDAVLIQSYINDEYKKFRSAFPGVLPGKAENLYRAEWNRDNYYKYLREYL